ncbi:SDR family oxidoreductase [Pedobacter heparinus]|uniref:dTDP-4-dehydrorhamnose reductase family protein n=1 Tax=Pedobacter heparinus TaxID=984 RepID=UPI00292D86E5|nr:SDR family oxidoreductase [Pedobacter heparinus]
MRILILGGDGMLGHQLYKSLKIQHEVKVTLRQGLNAYLHLDTFDNTNSFFEIDARDSQRLFEIILHFQPEAVINGVGIVKQRSDSKEIIPSLEINSLLPHKLAEFCASIGARFIHLSTDCVFSGRRGNYQENDFSDAQDIYGRTKFLGEVHGNNCLTLRTSIIGRELSRHSSLLDWFLSQKGPIEGFKNAIFTGFTTIEMARIINSILCDFPMAYGVYQVSSDPISKYDLLQLIAEKLGHDIEIIPNENFFCDRSLDSSRFRSEFNYTPPSWSDMIDELKL